MLQEGDLKYMVAFSSARAALEWCLTVQEAAMYLNWPAGLSKIPQVRMYIYIYSVCGCFPLHERPSFNNRVLIARTARVCVCRLNGFERCHCTKDKKHVC